MTERYGIAAEIWGDLDGKTRTERKFGKGRIIWGKTAREVLLADGIQPDFSYAGQTREPEKFDYIHRVDGQSEIYFVINRTGSTEVGDFSFRVTGKQPEIWDPVTGEMKEAGSRRTDLPVCRWSWRRMALVLLYSANLYLRTVPAKEFLIS